MLRMRVGLTRCRRAIVAPRQLFQRWAEEEKKNLKDVAPDRLVAYQLGPLVSHTDSLANFIEGVRETCLRLFVRGDEPRR